MNGVLGRLETAWWYLPKWEAIGHWLSCGILLRWTMSYSQIWLNIFRVSLFTSVWAIQIKSLRQNQILQKSFPRKHLEALQANQVKHINVAQNLLLGTSASAVMFSSIAKSFLLLS